MQNEEKKKEIDFERFGPRLGKFFKWYDSFLRGTNAKRGEGQMKVFKAYGSFMTGIAGVMIIIGMVAAFGFWALAVIGIIMALGMVSGNNQ